MGEARVTEERGSVLMLVPAGFLILMMLAAITFDFSHLWLGQRELSSLAEAAANDAATAGLNQDLFQATKELRLDPNRVHEVVSQSIGAHAHEFEILRWDAEAVTETTVRVTISARIDYIFAKTIPGIPHSQEVTVAAEADALQLPAP